MISSFPRNLAEEKKILGSKQSMHTFTLICRNNPSSPRRNWIPTQFAHFLKGKFHVTFTEENNDDFLSSFTEMELFSQN